MGYSCGFMRSAALQQELEFLKRVTLKGHRAFGSEAFLQGNLFQLTAWLGRAGGTFVFFLFFFSVVCFHIKRIFSRRGVFKSSRNTAECCSSHTNNSFVWIWPYKEGSQTLCVTLNHYHASLPLSFLVFPGIKSLSNFNVGLPYCPLLLLSSLCLLIHLWFMRSFPLIPKQGCFRTDVCQTAYPAGHFSKGTSTGRRKGQGSGCLSDGRNDEKSFKAPPQDWMFPPGHILQA